MQAEGDVIRFPERASVSVDFSTFFAEEHRGLFKALYFRDGRSGRRRRADAGAFLKLWERWDLVDRIDDPTAYLFRVALNGSRMRARRTPGRETPRPVVRDRDPFDEIRTPRRRPHALARSGPGSSIRVGTWRPGGP
jgi:DNA-directed RNA polymerase specialized sigma24 family protein